MLLNRNDLWLPQLFHLICNDDPGTTTITEFQEQHQHRDRLKRFSCVSPDTR